MMGDPAGSPKPPRSRRSQTSSPGVAPAASRPLVRRRHGRCGGGRGAGPSHARCFAHRAFRRRQRRQPRRGALGPRRAATPRQTRRAYTRATRILTARLHDPHARLEPRASASGPEPRASSKRERGRCTRARLTPACWARARRWGPLAHARGSNAYQRAWLQHACGSSFVLRSLRVPSLPPLPTPRPGLVLQRGADPLRARRERAGRAVRARRRRPGPPLRRRGAGRPGARPRRPRRSSACASGGRRRAAPRGRGGARVPGVRPPRLGRAPAHGARGAGRGGGARLLPGPALRSTCRRVRGGRARDHAALLRGGPHHAGGRGGDGRGLDRLQRPRDRGLRSAPRRRRGVRGPSPSPRRPRPRRGGARRGGARARGDARGGGAGAGSRDRLGPPRKASGDRRRRGGCGRAAGGIGRVRRRGPAGPGGRSPGVRRCLPSRGARALPLERAPAGRLHRPALAAGAARAAGWLPARRPGGAVVLADRRQRVRGARAAAAEGATPSPSRRPRSSPATLAIAARDLDRRGLAGLRDARPRAPEASPPPCSRRRSPAI